MTFHRGVALSRDLSQAVLQDLKILRAQLAWVCVFFLMPGSVA